MPQLEIRNEERYDAVAYYFVTAGNVEGSIVGSGNTAESFAIEREDGKTAVSGMVRGGTRSFMIGGPIDVFIAGSSPALQILVDGQQVSADGVVPATNGSGTNVGLKEHGHPDLVPADHEHPDRVPEDHPHPDKVPKDHDHSDMVPKDHEHDGGIPWAALALAGAVVAGGD